MVVAELAYRVKRSYFTKSLIEKPLVSILVRYKGVEFLKVSYFNQ